MQPIPPAVLILPLNLPLSVDMPEHYSISRTRTQTIAYGELKRSLPQLILLVSLPLALIRTLEHLPPN
jgi:hypothetical protein